MLANVQDSALWQLSTSSMEWIHLLLAFAVYIKVIVLVYYAIRYLSDLNRGRCKRPR